MLKRKGEFVQHEVPGFAARFTDGEMASYKAAFATIERDYRQIEKAKEQLERLTKVRWDELTPKPFDTVTTPDGNRWNAYALLLKLPKSEVLLCRRSDGSELAIVRRLTTDGPYAQTHGTAAILLTGSRSERELVTDYMAQAEHTLRFMARNIVARAQQVVWEKYPDHNPSQVVRAISERCALAVDNPQALKQTQTEEKTVRQSRGIRM